MSISSSGNQFTEMNKKAFITLIVLALSQFAVTTNLMIITPLSPFLENDLGINARQFGFIIASYSVAVFIAGMFGIKIVTNKDKKNNIIISLIALIIATFMLAASKSYLSIVISRFIAGIFGGFLSANILSSTTTIFGVLIRGRALGIVMMSFALSIAIGIPVGLKLSADYGWASSFYFVNCIFIVSLILAVLFLNPMKPIHLENTSIFQSLKTVMFNKWHILIFYFHMGVFLVSGFIGPYVPSFLVKNNGFNPANLWILYMISGVFNFFITPFSGYLSDKISPKKVYVIMALVFIVSIIMFSNMHNNNFIIVAMLFVIVNIGYGGLLSPATGIASMNVSPEYRSQFMVISGSLQQLFIGVTTIIGGSIAGIDGNGFFHTYWINGLACSGVVLINIFILKVLNRSYNS